MTNRDALLAAIRDNPDDDTPRLAYADWLDENATSDADRARAEFIRLNCSVLRLYGEFQAPECTDHFWGIMNRQCELLEQHRTDWFAAFPVPEAMQISDCRCGFLASLNLTAEQCLALPRPPWETEPNLGLTLTGTTEDLQKVIESDWLTGIGTLHLQQGVGANGDDIARAIATSPCATQLRELFVLNESLSDVGVQVIAESTRLRCLTRLDLAGAFCIQGWAAVVNGPVADRLTKLSLAYAAWGSERQPWSEAGAILAASPRLTGLQSLMIARTRLGTAGVRSVVTSPHLPNLRWLKFAQENFDATTGEALATATLPKLEGLEIVRSGLPDEAIRPLAKCGLFPRLTHLDWSNNPLTAEGIRALVEAGSLPRLKSLSLSQTQLGDAGLQVLARSPHFHTLVNLDLTSCRIGPKGVKTLAEASWADRLVRLTLSGNEIRKTGVETLTTPGRFTRLRRLDLEEAALSEDLKATLTARFGEGLCL